MNVIIKAKNFDLSSDLEEMIPVKLEKFSSEIDPQYNVQVTFEERQLQFRIEIIFRSNGMFIKEELREKTPYRAFTKALKKLEKKMHRINYKQSLRHHEEIHDFFDVELSSSEDKQQPHITRRKEFAFKPMMEDEAMLQMELLGHEFFMFFNAETNSMCLLYKRKDGHYGLIESAG